MPDDKKPAPTTEPKAKKEPVKKKVDPSTSSGSKDKPKTPGFSDIQPGMVVKVHQRIKEKNPKGEEKERVQVFEGTVLARKHGKGINSTITVRKMSGNIGVEKIFPLHLPSIEKIEVVKEIKSRRSKLYYLRNYKKRLKTKKVKESK